MATTIKVPDIPWVATGSPAPQVIRSEKRPQYLFIHTVRFWAMFAIVAMHCEHAAMTYRSMSPLTSALLIQPLKFGTIAFFVISGFLVGDRLPASNPLGYLRRRADRLIPAWVFWFGGWVLFNTQIDVVHMRHTGFSLAAIASSLKRNSVFCLTETPLWFIPNYLVALSSLVLLRRWLNDLRLGAVLFAVSVFYGVNVYTRWLPSRHTEALFAFVFYLWLGAWCALRKDRVQSWAAAQSVWWLSFGTCIAVGIAVWESTILAAHNSPDPVNSLRFGSQIYSILIVVFLIRFQRRTWPASINVGETTYGIFLSHAPILSIVSAAAMEIVLVRGHQLGSVGALLMWVLLTPTVYFLSLQLTRALASTERWGWIVGASSIQPQKLLSRTVLPEGAVITEA